MNIPILGAAWRRLQRRLGAATAARATERALRTLDDRMLRDLGLDRSQISSRARELADAR